MSDTSLETVFTSEILGYTPTRRSDTFEKLGLDSFDLVSLRAAIEARIGRAVPDEQWNRFRSPFDIAKDIADGSPSANPGDLFTETRSYRIGMPQMAVGGLSERWLFKEIGDFHWGLLSTGLGVKASALVDGSGNRLYATFTRVKMVSSAPWASYREDDPLDVRGSLYRYGAGQFFGEFVGTSGDRQFNVLTMSSFSARASEYSNTEMRKGQPTIPENCRIPNVGSKPQLAKEYQEARTFAYGEPLAKVDYRINPYTDINGVGLVYFAAYPTIADSCELSWLDDPSWAMRSSVAARDVFYFANADLSDALSIKALARAKIDINTETDMLIERCDGTPMALLRTKRVALSQ